MHLKPVSSKHKPKLGDADARVRSGLPDKDVLHEHTLRQQQRIGEMQRVFSAAGSHALLIVLQGRDAAGKDGAIRHVFESVDAQGCEVTSFKVPTALEMQHDYLWRVHSQVPARGMMGIFNRSHYEDVLVVRVRKFVPKPVWSARYDQINAFEHMLSENGVVILKFFLHVSRDEQKKRLQDRLNDPSKNWKFRAGDLADRASWKEFTAAYADVLRKCSTPWAPWYVVPADDKPVRNYLIANVIAETLEGLHLTYPRADKSVLSLKIT